MPIASENPRWSNSGSSANAYEARAAQGAKEHTGHEGDNANSPAKTWEARIAQEGSH